MMVEEQQGAIAFQGWLLKSYQEIFDDAADPLKRMREKAWDHFLELGLPTNRDEVFRYLRINNFFLGKFESSRKSEIGADVVSKLSLPECRNSILVFVNGHFSPELSCTSALPKKAVVTPLNDAMRTYGSFLNNQLPKAIKEETDPFAAINTALHRDGLFIYLPPKTVVDVPIQLLYLIDPQAAPLLIMPKTQVFVGAQAEVSLVTTQGLMSDGPYAFNAALTISIEESAHVHYTQMNCGITDRIWHFDAMRATLKRNSTLKVVNATDGAHAIRNDYRVALIGENAEVQLNGIGMLGEKREAHSHVLVDHQAPNCRSMQLFKSALKDFSRSSFEGKILVRRPAQKTEAFQLNNNLLLSDRAHADSKPNLEIFADDVKASHGATVGQLDKEQIFYLKTRGFTESQAASTLVYGFCEEVIDRIVIPSLRNQVKQLAKSWML